MVALAIIITFPLDTTYAAVENFIDKFAANNIMFYDPDACEGDGGGGIVGGEAVVSGSTAAEKVWSGLKSMGLSDYAVAGIMGNMMHESNSFNPAQHEGSLTHILIVTQTVALTVAMVTVLLARPRTTTRRMLSIR